MLLCFLLLMQGSMLSHCYPRGSKVQQGLHTCSGSGYQGSSCSSAMVQQLMFCLVHHLPCLLARPSICLWRHLVDGSLPAGCELALSAADVNAAALIC